MPGTLRIPARPAIFMTAADRLFSPAAERNRQPMLAVLRRVLPAAGRALEIASGSGQHVAWFARQLPAWTWQPTDFAAPSLPSIAAWSVVTADDLADDATPEAAPGPLRNVAPPVQLDVCAAVWPVSGKFDAMVCANMLHIAPWACCAGLMLGAARYLAADGVLVTYGPYLEDDVATAPSNASFDADLRRRDPDWGLRRLADVVAQARAAGLRLRERVAMPANNLMLVFERDVPPA